MLKPNDTFTVILSRTDSIGDVVLTLPMAGVIKEHYPNARVVFLGRNYTKDVVALSQHVDEFISYDELLALPAREQINHIKPYNADYIVHVFPVKHIAQLAKKAGIKTRIGTTNRFYHWFTCNKLLRLSRKNSNLHEAQLNIHLLQALDISKTKTLAEINDYYGFKNVPSLDTDYKSLIDPSKTNIILHPKSKGSAREWGLDNFSELINTLPTDRYKLFISGTKQEGDLIRPFLEQHKHRVTDLTGKLSLQQFIAFINACDGLVAASTGPLHIAAALGKKVVGLYVPMRPIHPGRWQPIGKKATYLVLNKDCFSCKNGSDCLCIKQLSVTAVIQKLEA